MKALDSLRAKQASSESALQRRLLLIGITGAIVVGVFVALQNEKQSHAPIVRDQTPPPAQIALPVVDTTLLAQVRDAALEDQVLLEPEPYAHLSQLALALLPNVMKRLGEPAFPFADAAVRAAELRGQPFRARGTLLTGELLARSTTAPREYWAVVRTDDGREFIHVSAQQPEYPFVDGDFVLADGYFFKHYSRMVAGERRTLPLFLGRELLTSARRMAPATRPDPVALAGVVDPHVSEDLPKDDAAMWHLMNVARTLQADPPALEAAFADAPWLDVALLKELDRTPEAFRGAPIRIAGFISLGEVWPVEENPIGASEYSEAWVANSNFGDVRVMLRTPGRVDFTRLEGILEFRGWFQQMWAYEAQTGDRFRIPLFVFADAKPVPAPASGGNRAWTVAVIVTTVGLTGLLYALVRRDRARSAAAEARLNQRRRERLTQGG